MGQWSFIDQLRAQLGGGRGRSTPTADAGGSDGPADIMLCHNSKDKPEVRDLAARLRAKGLEPWLDEERLVAGKRWLGGLAQALQTAPAVAILLGRHGKGPWEEEEFDVAIAQAVERKIPVMAVFLPGCAADPVLSPFLRTRMHVDFRAGYDDRGLERICEAVRGTVSDERVAQSSAPNGSEKVCIDAVMQWLALGGVAAVLTGVLQLPSAEDLPGIANTLVEMVKADHLDLACALYVADEKLRTNPAIAPDIIEQHPMLRIFEALLPCASSSQATMIGQCSNTVDAEAMRSAADNHPPAWRDDADLVLIGERAVPPTAPEAGFNQQQHVQTIVTYLAARFRYPDTQDPPDVAYRDALVGEVRDHLALNRRRWKYAQPDSFPRYAIVRSEGLKKALNDKLPALDVVVLMPSEDSDSLLVKAVWELMRRKRWQATEN